MDYLATCIIEVFKVIGSGLLVYVFTYLIERNRRNTEKNNLCIALCSELRKCCILLSCSLELPPNKIYNDFNLQKIETIYQKLIPFISSEECQDIEDIIDNLNYLQDVDLTSFNDIVSKTTDKIETIYNLLKPENMPDINYKSKERIERLINKIYKN